MKIPMMWQQPKKNTMKNNFQNYGPTGLHQDLNTEYLQLEGALTEHFLEGIALLRHCHINPNEKSNKYKSSLLS